MNFSLFADLSNKLQWSPYFLIKRIQKKKFVRKDNMDLYKDHEIKDELVIGPEEIRNIASPAHTSSEILDENSHSKIRKCTLCIADSKASHNSQTESKCCSKCQATFKCVHYLNKHVERYHGTSTCKVCKVTFKTRIECCRHLCPGYVKLPATLKVPVKRKVSEKSFDASSDTIHEVKEIFEAHDTNTSTSEVSEDSDCEFEFIIQSERSNSPPITITPFKKRERNHNISEDTDINSHNSVQTLGLIDNQNSTFLAGDEMEIKVKKELMGGTAFNVTAKDNNNSPKEKMEIETVTIEDSENEDDNFTSENKIKSELLNMTNDKIQQDIIEETNVTIAVSEDIETGESNMVTKNVFKTDTDGTNFVILMDSHDNATETNNIMTHLQNIKTEIDLVIVSDSDDESVSSEIEFDMIRIIHEENKAMNELIDAEKGKNIDDTADDDNITTEGSPFSNFEVRDHDSNQKRIAVDKTLPHKNEKKSNLEKSHSSISCDNSEFTTALQSTDTLRCEIDTVKRIKKDTLSVYTCTTCNKAFPSILHVQNHEETHACGARHAKLPEYCCHICKKVFYTESEVTLHKNIHKPRKGLHACATCNKTFPSILHLQKHECRARHSEMPKYFCHICKKTFYGERDVAHHTTIHKLGKNLNTAHAGLEKCKYCNILLSKTDLHYHMLFYHKQSEHIVNLEENMSRPVFTDKRVTDFQCRFCTKIYNARGILNHHIEQEHKNETNNRVQVEQIQANMIKESYIHFKDF